MNLLEQVLVDNLDELGLRSVGLDQHLQTVLLTPRFVTSRHVVALVLAPGDRRPRAVVKVPRCPGDDAGVQTEARVLRQLTASPGSPSRGVPHVLGTLDVDGRTVLVETSVNGVPLGRAEVLRDVDRALAAGLSFIAGLPLVRDGAHNAGWYDRAVTAPLVQLQHLVPDEGDVAGLAARTHELLAPLRAVPLPAVVEHGDLSHPNLFLDDSDDLLVIDWERASDAGLPGHDLVFFAQFVSQCLHGFATRDQQVTAFERAFVGPGAWARPALDRHLSERGVDPQLSGLLILASWARTAATLASRLGAGRSVREGATAAVAAAVLAERDVVLWRHALDRAEDGALSSWSSR